jgi:hypothetical protein
VLCARLCFAIWYLQSVELQYGAYGVSFLFCLYLFGSYVFCLAYELYDGRRAVRLTLIFAVTGVVALGLMIGALAALAFIQSGAAFAVSEGQKTKAMSIAASFAGTGDGMDENGGKHAAGVPGLAMVTCKHCNRDFFPVPPTAICPWCDTPYLSAEYGPAVKAS